MAQRRKPKKGIIDEFFSGSLFNEFPLTGNDSYSISVVQTPEGTKVKAKVGKDVDVNALKKRLQEEYPKAEIEIEGGRKEPLIREISTKTMENEKSEN